MKQDHDSMGTGGRSRNPVHGHGWTILFISRYESPGAIGMKIDPKEVTNGLWDEVVQWSSDNNAGYTGLTLKGGDPDMPASNISIGRQLSGVTRSEMIWLDARIIQIRMNQPVILTAMASWMMVRIHGLNMILFRIPTIMEFGIQANLSLILILMAILLLKNMKTITITVYPKFSRTD